MASRVQPLARLSLGSLGALQRSQLGVSLRQASGRRRQWREMSSIGASASPSTSTAAAAAGDIDLEVGVLEPKDELELSSGKRLPAGSLRIKYALMGNPDGEKLLLCPSMSNSVFAVDGTDLDGSPQRGWWRKVVGHGGDFGIDLDRFRVIVGAPLGAPFGSTSPLTPTSRAPDSALFRNHFPRITPRDQALHQRLLLRELGVDKVSAVVGGSMGGMQALQFAALFPELYDRFAAIAATAQTSPGTVALRFVQREAVRADPDFHAGEYAENPKQGMGVARMFGTICYRSPSEFDGRFDWFPTELEHSGQASFEVERYLQHQALKFTTQVNYDANCYLLLSQSMDLMDIGQNVGSFEAGAGRIPADKEGLLLSYSTDRLTPAKDLERLATVLGTNKVPVHFETLESKYGHDAFLVEGEAQAINIRLRAFLHGPRSRSGENVDAVHKIVKDMFEH